MLCYIAYNIKLYFKILIVYYSIYFYNMIVLYFYIKFQSQLPAQSFQKTEPITAIIQAQRAIQHYNAVQHQIRQHQIAQLKRTTSQIPDQSVNFEKQDPFNFEHDINVFEIKDENSSDISARSKPNSNGHNVRFVDEQPVQGKNLIL